LSILNAINGGLFPKVEHIKKIWKTRAPDHQKIKENIDTKRNKLKLILRVLIGVKLV